MRPRRNSLVPLVLVLLTVAGALLWLAASPVAEPGAEGPRFEPGIFRLPKDERKLVRSADMEVRCEAMPSWGTLEEIRSLELWRVILVHAPAGHPVESSIALALAEELTRRGSVVVLSNADAPPFPMPADMYISLEAEEPSTQGEPLLPHGKMAPYRVMIGVGWDYVPKVGAHHCEPMFRNLQLFASGHQPAKGSGVAWDCHFQVRIGKEPSWSEWYAAAGRQVAQALIDRATGGQRLPLVDPATGRWFKTILPRADWGSSLHLPPQCDGLAWRCCFQEEFVRGWIGFFRNTAAKDPCDLADLERRLESGRWRKEGEGRHWIRQQDGITTHFQLDLGKAVGFSVSCWQGRPDATAVIRHWLQDMDAPDGVRADIARRQLTRYRQIDGIPLALTEEIFAKLGLRLPVGPE